MALLDIFRKKQEDKKAKMKEAEKENFTSAVKVAQELTEKDKENKLTASKIVKKDFSYIAYKVLKSPHITEKAVNLGEQNKYIFKVSQDANKVEIKKAIQDLYGIKVEDVNTVNIPSKKRRLGRSKGFKSGYKKAIVTVAEGEKIESGM